MNETEQAARRIAAAGRPVLVARAQGKAPLTRHGVKDATTDYNVIARWFDRWPDANLAIATGAPGPTVLDIDDLDAARDLLPDLYDLHSPIVATPRGRHYYFAGQSRGTIGLGYGELRGQGSYVLCPPSVVDGKTYTWLAQPTSKLPTVPDFITKTTNSTWGKGEMPDVKTVAPGEMYDHLGDLATRLACAGVTHPDVIERVLLVEFDAVHVPGADYGDPAQGRQDTRRLAQWANSSKIANRERAVARLILGWRANR